MSKRYTIVGTITVDVTATVEAESRHDAAEMLDTADCCVESCDENIVFNCCCQSHCEVGGVTCDAEKKWDSLSKFERMEMLIGNGASDDAAYDIAARDFDDVPKEWQMCFE